jgi:hypothetical protein
MSNYGKPEQPSPPSQASNPGQLMDEALGLAKDLGTHSDELLHSGLESIRLIEAQQAATGSVGVVAKFGHILASNGELSKRMGQLLNMAHSILRECNDSNYRDKIRQLIDDINEIDPAKIADEDLLREMERRRDNVFAAPDILSACAASAEIPIFFLAFAHSDLFQAYVNKPPLSRRALDNASLLVGAAAVDFAGSVIPFFGTALTVFQLLEPWIKRETKRVLDAIPVVDRLFNFDDGLTALLEFSAVVEGSTRQVAEFLSAYRRSFDEDVRWLTDVAKRARRS